MNEERAMDASAEVDKLLHAGFIQEVQYPKWLSNMVLVKKSNGNWRMCVDFKDLNKAYPKLNGVVNTFIMGRLRLIKPFVSLGIRRHHMW